MKLTLLATLFSLAFNSAIFNAFSEISVAVILAFLTNFANDTAIHPEPVPISSILTQDVYFNAVSTSI